MINLIRMNNYKAIHTKSLKAVLIVAVALVVLVYYVTLKVDNLDTGDTDSVGLSPEIVANLEEAGASSELIEFISECDNSDELMKELESGNISEETMNELKIMMSVAKQDEAEGDEGVEIGITSNAGEDDKDSIFGYILDDFTNGITLLFLSIATALFVNADEKDGFVKNIAGQSRHRSYIYLSKIVTISIYALIFLAIYGGGLGLVCAIFGDNMELVAGGAGAMAAKLAVAYLLTIAYISGVAMLASVMRSSTFAVIAGIGCSMDIDAPIFIKLDNLLNTHMYEYTPKSVLTDVVGITRTSGYMKAVLVGVGFFAVFNFIGAYVAEKRDAV